MDLDCVASIVLARYLFPDHVPVRSSLVHPSARKLLNLYEDRLGFAAPGDLKGERIERMVVVDARSLDRVSEHLKGADPGAMEIEVFDHHPPAGRDIPGALVHERALGANASHLALILKERGAKVSPEDATVALVGIYSDTGNFTHENAREEDFEAAAWLLAAGASLKLVKDLIEPLKERRQLVLFHEVLNRLERRTVRGYLVQTCYFELEEDALGLGAVIERVFEIEDGEILFGFFYFPSKGKMLVIARNSVEGVRLDEILADLGGGGHAKAASATVKTQSGPELAEMILAYLEAALVPAATARDIMSEDVFTIDAEVSLLAASMFLERVNHTGVPVVGEGGKLVGFLTLRDIMTGRRASQMHVPLKTFMSRKLVTAPPGTTVREIDDILFENNIGHLPIVEEGRLVGIVTRSDFLAFKRSDRRRRGALLAGLGA